jgi:hypothetical protein
VVTFEELIYMGNYVKSVERRLFECPDRIVQDVQNVRPARPQAKEAPEAYPLGYVEDASEPRTKLGDIFNILSERSHA